MGMGQPNNNRRDRHMGRCALTCVHVPRPAPAKLHYTSFMNLLPRDRQLVALVARFKQLSASQLQALVFPDGRSLTPYYKRINHLVDLGFIARVNERLPGGDRGGSNMYVYQLGTEGWRQYKRGQRRKTSRVINAHTLAIGNAHVSVFNADREGWLKLLDFATEPDCHIVLGGLEIRPDFYLDVAVRARAERLALWLEVDLDSEDDKTIMGKLSAYVHAYKFQNEFPLPAFPTVLFLADTEARASKLRIIVAMYEKKYGTAPKHLFNVATLAEYPAVLTTLNR